MSEGVKVFEENEILDLYDAEGNLTGETIRRGVMPPEGGRLLIVHLCILHPDGRLLVQKRQETKLRFPGAYDLSCGGFAQHGENARQAMVRECAEELGITITEEEPAFLFRVPFKVIFDDFFLLRRDLDPAALKLQEEEVSGAEWMSREEVLRLRKIDRFVDYDPDLLARIFDEAEKRG